jgi:polyhydroxybutyrate depolymerase
MKSRKPVLAAVVVLISVPVMLALAEGVSYHVRNRNNGTIVSSGLTREYLLYVPRSYDRAKPTALVISLHGAGMWPASQMEASRWNDVADTEGFIVVYPSGLDGNGPRVWEVNRGPGLLQDVKFISDLIDTLQTSYNIDPTRIYANGLSNGGGMSFVLSCTLSDRIAAVGMVGAALLLEWSWCTDTRPIPMIAFHGTADTAAPYHGGKSWVSSRPFANVPTFTANWARRNRCAATPIEASIAADVTRLQYTDCAPNAPVMLYRIEDGGHTWPGGGPLPEWFVGPTTHSIDASRTMWEFFREHPLGSGDRWQATGDGRQGLR